MTDYAPINCSLYDVLEATAVRGKIAEIIYRDATGRTHQISARIEDLYSTAAKEEYAKLSGGLTLRLDRLVSVDGMTFEGVCVEP